MGVLHHAEALSGVSEPSTSMAPSVLPSQASTQSRPVESPMSLHASSLPLRVTSELNHTSRGQRDRGRWLALPVARTRCACARRP